MRRVKLAHAISRGAGLGLMLLVALGALPAHAAPWAGNRADFADARFAQVWRDADQEVQLGRAARSWTWGPQPWFDYREVYQQAPNGTRLVQYFDKARMELTRPTAADGPFGGVTNGLLTVELVSGRLKLGDGVGSDQNLQLQPSLTPVAGDLPDLATRSQLTPGYEAFAAVATIDNGYHDVWRPGERVGATMSAGGQIGFDARLAALPGTDIVRFDDVTGHNVPRVFAEFWNRSPVAPLAVFGYPIAEAYWVRALVKGVERDVLVQLFERRTLTYTPANPAAYRVEMGNVGQHYFFWRYGRLGKPWSTSDPQLPITYASAPGGGSFEVFETDGQAVISAGGAANALLPSSVLGYWEPTLPDRYRVVYGDTTAFNGKRQLAMLVPQAPLRDRLLDSDANDYQPAISPDGTQIAFVSDRDGNPELYLLMLQTYHPQVIQLTTNAGCANEHPSWLPDGSGLVFESNCGTGSYEIYRAGLSYSLDRDARLVVPQLISPLSGVPAQLTTSPGDDRWPRVSPDGTTVAFFSTRDGNAEIYSMRIDGQQQTRLTESAARDEAPAWSPDGRQLVFNSDRDGDHELFVMSRDGSAQRQLTFNGDPDGYAVWGP